MRVARVVAAVAVGTAVLAGLAGCASAPGTTGALAGDRPSTARASSFPPSSAPAPTTAAPSTSPTAAAPAPENEVPVNYCAHNTAAQLVLVSIARQHLWMCARNRTVYSTAVTTGMAGPDTRTPTGRFHIQGLNRNSVLTLNTGQQYDVKYWIPFQAPLFGFHDSSWQHFAYGSPQYKTAGSHGCVHMPLTAIAFLYRWAHIGASVLIS